MLGLVAPAGDRAGRRAASSSRPSGLAASSTPTTGSTAVRDRAEDGLPVRHQRGEWWAHAGSSAWTMSYHGDTLGSVSVGGIELFHSLYQPLLFDAWQAGPATPRRCDALLDEHADVLAAVIVEPLVQGAAGMPLAARRLPARGARAVRRARRAADLRRGRDRLRAHGDDVRVRARGRDARPDVRRQGADRRLPAARRDAHHRGDLRGLPRRATSSSARSSTATPTPATRSPARPRSPRSTSSSRSRRSSACSRRSTLLGELLDRGGRAAGRRRRDPPPRLHGRHRAAGLPAGGPHRPLPSRSRPASAARSSARSATRSC